MIEGYNGVRNASSIPLARFNPAEKFVSVSPAVGLGPKININKKMKAEKLYIGISFLSNAFELI
jgi:hypothetical protein